MKNSILIHIPHSSYCIPKEYKDLFYLSSKKILFEQIKMTVSYTDELFNIPEYEQIVFPISRLICDVERFREEKDEEMSKQGMWVCYEKTHNLKPLKKVMTVHKEEILTKYYDPHHRFFKEKTEEILDKCGKCFIIDAHSFSSKALKYELYKNKYRPDICIGVDDFHTPESVVKYLYGAFSKKGYKVGVNNPFKGTIVPIEYYNKNNNVISVMIEINRKLYMDESSGEKNKNFKNIKNDITDIIQKFLSNPCSK